MAATVPGRLLQVENLSIDARTPEGLRSVLESVSFDLATGETLCLAGESGSGKSLTALAIMRLLSTSLRVQSGRISLAGRDLTALSNRAYRSVRGGDIAMIFQEPMTSLNPVLTIGRQLTETIREHGATDGESAEARARTMLDAVHMSESARRMGQYPHELSGGMRQRVMIAMALSCRPKVLIADEPTTALDVTVQAQILTLMRELRKDFGTSIVLITHDMGVVAQMADRVVLLKTGRIVEQGNVLDIFERPREGYTRELLASVLRLGSRAGTNGPPRVTATKASPDSRSLRAGVSRQGPHRRLWPIGELVGASKAKQSHRQGDQLRDPAGTDARTCRRERLGQVHDRQGRAGSAAVFRQSGHRWRQHCRAVSAGHAAGARQGANDLSGSVCVA